jgi:hypothetical protein
MAAKALVRSFHTHKEQMSAALVGQKEVSPSHHPFVVRLLWRDII